MRTATKSARFLSAAMLFAALSVNAATSKSATPPVVNVNTATVQQLSYLPGVGAALASRIVAGRPYRVQGSLLYVKGIKDAKLKVMFHFVTVNGATTATRKIATCKAGETGAQCQARVGERAEVVQYPNGALVIESK